MLHPELDSLLRQAMGLDAASIGSSAVERAVMGRMLLCGLGDVGVYLDRIRASDDELQALIEAVVVPETWFFRDREAFAELARAALEEWLPGHAEGALRVLSVPCSSGEEPYSISMTLLDAGFAPGRCRIEGVDISAQGIKAARNAVYGKNSFRVADLQFRDRHFKATAFGWRLSDAAREPVQFRQGNLLAEDFRPGAEIYDFIFCRNLLIYFDRNAQDRAVEVLRRLLKPEGLLFIGPSESGLLLSHGFVSSKAPLAFAFRRGDSKYSVALPAPVRPALKVPQVPAKSAVPALSLPASSVLGAVEPEAGRRSAGKAEPATTQESALAEASRLADEGRLAEAAKACEDNLSKYGPSVTSFFLLGVIRAAAGNADEARDYYRKALYLDLNHQDTLIHLGLLLENQGNQAGAQAIYERLQRVVNNRRDMSRVT
jgi:chemotaxis protein methyltransferase WspC